MCMPTKLPSDSSFHGSEMKGKAQALKPSFLKTTTRIAIMISIPSYLFHRGGEVDLDMITSQLASKSLLPYLLMLAFLLNAPRKCFTRLRGRFNNWTKGSIPSAISSRALQSLSSSQALSRISSTDTIRKLSKSICSSLAPYRIRATLQAITRKECFARLDYIEQLSISDMVTLFRFATDVNQVDFNKKRFMAEQSQLLRSISAAVDMSVTISRGTLSGGAKLTGERREGDVDALYFVAVTRIFAEWRTLRLVPKGHKRYAVALNLAYRDVLQNLAKIEDGVHSYLKHYESLQQPNNEQPIPSPTLRQLLKHELDTNVHSRLPYLDEKSAASGLLWTKRQLHYQTSTFTNSLQVPFMFSSPKDAAIGAYNEVYDAFHGWAVKQVFSHSFGGSPPLEKIWKSMEPPERDNSNNVEEGQQHVLQRKLSEVSEDGEFQDNEVLLALEDFGKHVADKWGEFLGLLNCVSADEERKQSSQRNLIESHFEMNILEGKFTAALPAPDQTQETADPIQKVKSGTEKFVQEMRPLVKDLNGLIHELNMNDPSKV